MQQATVANESHTGVWVRTYGRFHPDADPFGTLLFERPATAHAPQSIALVTVHTDADLRADVAAGWQSFGSVALCVRFFPDDEAMPSIATVLASARAATVVRYRPLRRCTIRVEQPDGARYAKVFPDVTGARIHADALHLQAMAVRGELGFDVAAPVRWDEETRTLWQHAVPGVPAAPQLFGTDGAAMARRMGAAAASLVRSRVRPTERFDASAQINRTRRYAAELTRRVPALGDEIDRLLDRLGRLPAGATPGLRPIHGAPHPHQWLVHEDRLGLVDFDRLALGDAEMDVATFLGELETEDELGAPLESLTGEFLDAYQSRAGRLDHHRLLWYRAHKRLAKALRSVRSLRVDGDARSARHVTRAIALAEARV